MNQHISKPEKPMIGQMVRDFRAGRYGSNVLDAFRQGWDTERIARVYEVPEAEAHNALARARGQQTEAGPRRGRRL